MTKYLYGASVQGIQEFIFKTNKLKEIVGASEIVEDICTNFFKKNCPNFNDENLIIGAAGNIKYVFDSDKDCNKLVLQFSKNVMEKAPGITISQAVVKIHQNEDGIKTLSDAINELEKRLKTQRNKVTYPYEIGFMGLERARRTGGVAIAFKENMAIDQSTNLKQKEDSASLFSKLTGIKFPRNEEITYNIEEICKGGKNKWIAVIHADGNGLGKLLQSIGKSLKDNDDLQFQIQTFRNFSIQLENSTIIAAQKAFDEVIKKEKHNDKYPIRPIIIGGDDVTFIVRADLAIPFIQQFIEEFEKNCEKNIKFSNNIQLSNKITSCAGIAFVKESYPFHYAADLAEKLCKEAKHYSKNSFQEEVPSSISFFKVQDSFIEDELDDIRNRTGHTNKGDNSEKYIDFNYGPYLLVKNGDKPNLPHFNNYLKILFEEASKKDKTKAVSKLRQLVTESFVDIDNIEMLKVRMNRVNEDFYKKLNLDFNMKINEKSPIYELIQIHTLKY